MAEPIPSLVVVPGLDTGWITELVLYDFEEKECGTAGPIDDERWHCEYNDSRITTTLQATNYKDAIDFLWRKCKEHLGGKGFIVAHLEMRIDNGATELSATAGGSESGGIPNAG